MNKLRIEWWTAFGGVESIGKFERMEKEVYLREWA